MFAPSPSLHFSVHFFFSIYYPLSHPGFTVFEVALHRKRIPKSMQRNLLLTPLHLKLKIIQGLFKDSSRNSRTFSRLCEPWIFLYAEFAVGIGRSMAYIDTATKRAVSSFSPSYVRWSHFTLVAHSTTNPRNRRLQESRSSIVNITNLF